MKKLYKYKWIKILFATLLVCAVPVTVIAVKSATGSSEVSGKFTSETVNRVNITLENTDVVLKKTADSEETFVFNLTFSMSKAEADFYACIDSFEITGLNYDKINYTAAKANNGVYLLKNSTLSSENGTPIVYSWDIQLTLTAKEACVISPSIVLTYTSGMTYDSSEQHITEIPFTVTVK